jgi:aspartyl/asparaginyl beta-hydroxylase (cupin superfamily)
MDRIADNKVTDNKSNAILWILIITFFIITLYYIDSLYALTGNNIFVFSWMRTIDRYFSQEISSSRLWFFDILFWAITIYLVYMVSTGDLEKSYKIGLSILLAVLPLLLIFPLLGLYNQIVWIFCTNSPMNLDKDRYFPGHYRFEDKENFKKIKKEIQELINKDELQCFHYYQATDLDNHNKKKCWKWFPLLDQKGWYEGNSKKLPTLTNLIKGDDSIVSASISIIEPGMGIPEHKGYLQSVLRYHLGVIIPTDSSPYIVCGGEKYHWVEGEGVMFDDMYLHYVVNPSEHRRAVLWLDILRNDLPVPINWIVYFFHGVINSIRSLNSFDKRIHEQKGIKSNIDEEGNEEYFFVGTF